MQGWAMLTAQPPYLIPSSFILKHNKLIYSKLESELYHQIEMFYFIEE